MSKKIAVLGVFINAARQRTLLNEALILVKSAKKPAYIVTPNPEIILRAQNNRHLLDILNRADLSLPDGSGVIWAGAILKNRRFSFWSGLKHFFLLLIGKNFSVFPERVTGADFVLQLSRELKSGQKIFLLGGGEGVAAAAAQALLAENPRLEIVGVSAAAATPDQDLYLRKAITAAQTEILFVAFGCPKQELWLERNLSHLPTVKLALGVGGTFDFLSGRLRRAPLALRKMGLEWIYRLFLEPKRLPRIFRATVTFPLLFLSSHRRLDLHGK